MNNRVQMSAPEGTDPSRLRQRLAESERRRREPARVLLSERGPMIRGTFQRKARRCGKPNCKCVRGPAHPTTVLASSEEGELKTCYVPEADRARVELLASRYQRFRRARAELARLARQSLQLADQLQRSLTEPYPATPPPRARRTSRPRPGSPR